LDSDYREKRLDGTRNCDPSRRCAQLPQGKAIRKPLVHKVIIPFLSANLARIARGYLSLANTSNLRTGMPALVLNFCATSSVNGDFIPVPLSALAIAAPMPRVPARCDCDACHDLFLFIAGLLDGVSTHSSGLQSNPAATWDGDRAPPNSFCRGPLRQ
jgi:hypothetical protein